MSVLGLPGSAAARWQRYRGSLSGLSTDANSDGSWRRSPATTGKACPSNTGLVSSGGGLLLTFWKAHLQHRVVGLPAQPGQRTRAYSAARTSNARWVASTMVVAGYRTRHTFWGVGDDDGMLLAGLFNVSLSLFSYDPEHHEPDHQ